MKAFEQGYTAAVCFSQYRAWQMPARHNENAAITSDDAFEAFDVIQTLFAQSKSNRRLKQRLEDRTDAQKKPLSKSPISILY